MYSNPPINKTWFYLSICCSDFLANRLLKISSGNTYALPATQMHCQKLSWATHMHCWLRICETDCTAKHVHHAPKEYFLSQNFEFFLF